MKKLEVVVGAQFGSEAKGHVVQRLAERAIRRDEVPVEVIRVAGPNAGHTGYAPDGSAVALRQVPVAAVVDGPVVLGIAAGSEIDLPVLLAEIDDLRERGLFSNKYLWVSPEATLITQEHKDVETGVGRDDTDNLIYKIGSTGKGIGAARAERLMRRATRLGDDPAAMRDLIDRDVLIAEAGFNTYTDGHIIIEGTQGFGLGLHAGYYPQCTSSDCRAIDFLAMAGLNPWDANQFQVWAVARIFPIRVAGNSGPLKDETTWEALGLPEERTTVTKKVRRVSQPDWDLVARAVEANGGHRKVALALTMVDQLLPHYRDVTFYDKEFGSDLDALIRVVEHNTIAEVGMITTGPNAATIKEHYR